MFISGETKELFIQVQIKFEYYHKGQFRLCDIIHVNWQRADGNVATVF